MSNPWGVRGKPKDMITTPTKEEEHKGNGKAPIGAFISPITLRTSHTIKNQMLATTLEGDWRMLYLGLFDRLYRLFRQLPVFTELHLMVLERICYMYVRQKMIENQDQHVESERKYPDYAAGYSELARVFRRELRVLVEVSRRPEAKVLWLSKDDELATLSGLMKTLMEEAEQVLPDQAVKDQLFDRWSVAVKKWKDCHKRNVKEAKAQSAIESILAPMDAGGSS